MTFMQKTDPTTGEVINDKTKVVYNQVITIEGIPEQAYSYVINGKPALEWIMQR